jgi:hypothetical protein
MYGIQGSFLPPERVGVSRPKRGRTACQVVSDMSDQFQLNHQPCGYEIHPVGLAVPEWASLYEQFKARRASEYEVHWKGGVFGDLDEHNATLNHLMQLHLVGGVSSPKLFFDVTLQAASARTLGWKMLPHLAWMDAIRHAGVPLRSPVTQNLRVESDDCTAITNAWFAWDRSLAAGYFPSPAELVKRAQADGHCSFMCQLWYALKLESRQMRVSVWLGIDDDPDAAADD